MLERGYGEGRDKKVKDWLAVSEVHEEDGTSPFDFDRMPQGKVEAYLFFGKIKHSPVNRS